MALIGSLASRCVSAPVRPPVRLESVKMEILWIYIAEALSFYLWQTDSRHVRCIWINKNKSKNINKTKNKNKNKDNSTRIQLNLKFANFTEIRMIPENSKNSENSSNSQNIKIKVSHKIKTQI